MEQYPSGRPSEAEYNRFSLVDNGASVSNVAFTLEDLNLIAANINTNQNTLLTANQYILQSILLDAYMGRAYEIIYANINTEYRLTYPELSEDYTEEDLEKVKTEIENFNKFINIEKNIKEPIMGVFREGNYSMFLRLVRDGENIVSALIDHYPLKVCYPSNYLVDGDTILEFNIAEMKARIKSNYPKTRKGRKEIYFEKVSNEIKANYPEEVYQGFVDKESIVRLDDRYSAYMKINDMGFKYGVSPFFKALKALVVLNNIEAADVADSKTRSKKIIFQKLRKELLGNNGEKKGFAEMAYAHQAAAAALKTNFCLYTAPAFVEDLSYVIDKSTNDATADSIKTYTSKLLTALGIGFADSELSSYSIANISVDQLMRTINAIARQLERIYNKFYQVYLEELRLPKALAPEISICDSEMMEWNLKKEFAQFAYSTLNVSRDTAFRMVGLDVKDEQQKREVENAEHLDAVFSPRPTAYNSSVTVDNEQSNLDADGEEIRRGRPKSSDDIGKQAFDEEYSKGVR